MNLNNANNYYSDTSVYCNFIFASPEAYPFSRYRGNKNNWIFNDFSEAISLFYATVSPILDSNAWPACRCPSRCLRLSSQGMTTLSGLTASLPTRTCQEDV